MIFPVYLLSFYDEKSQAHDVKVVPTMMMAVVTLTEHTALLWAKHLIASYHHHHHPYFVAGNLGSNKAKELLRDYGVSEWWNQDTNLG